MNIKQPWFIRNPFIERILYFQCDNGVTLVIMKSRRQEILDIPLIRIEQMLPSDIFYRVHRSYLVNKNAISEFRYYRTQLLAIVHGYRIPVSRRCRRIILNGLDTV